MEAMSGGKAAANRIIPGFDDRLNEEYEKTRMLEPLITADIRKVTSQLGTGLTGVEFSVKTGTSIADKLERAKQYADEARAKIAFLGGKTAGKFDPHAELAKMKDVIRYTEICPHDDIISTTKRTIEEMKKQGYELSGVKNYYANPFTGTGYMGVHLNFISPYGNEFELQVHSKESFDVKQKGHDLYEKIRAVGTRPEDPSEHRKTEGLRQPEGFLDGKVGEKRHDVKKRGADRRQHLFAKRRRAEPFNGILGNKARKEGRVRI